MPQTLSRKYRKTAVQMNQSTVESLKSQRECIKNDSVPDKILLELYDEAIERRTVHEAYEVWQELMHATDLTDKEVWKRCVVEAVDWNKRLRSVSLEPYPSNYDTPDAVKGWAGEEVSHSDFTVKQGASDV